MTQGGSCSGAEKNLLSTFPRQYMDERNQVCWAYTYEEKGRLTGDTHEAKDRRQKVLIY